MISIIIPTYRNPEYLELCLQSCIDGQKMNNQIIVVVDGFIEESTAVLDQYRQQVDVIEWDQNRGMQAALNIGVMYAKHEQIFIINDDNVLPNGFDSIIDQQLTEKQVLTLNQIEPDQPGLFNFHVKDFGRTPKMFDYTQFVAYEQSIRKEKITDDGGIFPFAMYKKYYMAAGGFDEQYPSPFICDWDFFLKLELIGLTMKRTHQSHLYHFGSAATKHGKEGSRFMQSEQKAAKVFFNKWGILPQLFKNNSHNPKHGNIIRGIKFD